MIRKTITTTLVIVWFVMIYAFSAQPDVQSSQISGHVSYQIVSSCNELFELDQSVSQMEETALRIEFPVRKAAHMSEYAILALLLLSMFYAYSRRPDGKEKIYRLLFLALFCAMAYACTDEFHQLFIPGRAGRITDVLIDTTGAAIALLIAGLFLLKRNKKNRKR